MAVKIICTVLLWFLSSWLTNATNKYLLKEHPFPLTLTEIQFIIIILYCFLLRKYTNFVRETDSRKQLHQKLALLKTVVPLSFAHIGTRVFHQIALQYIPISFAHTIKSTGPIFTVMVSRFITGEQHSRESLMSLIPIIFGVSMASLTEISFNLIGFISALLGTLTLTWLNVGTKNALETKRINQVELLLYTDIVAAIILIPFWLHLEGFGLVTVALQSGTYSLIALLNSICYFGQVLSAFILLGWVSTLTYSVISVSKRVFVITASILYFGNAVTITNVVGTTLAISGVFYYSYAKVRETNKSPSYVKIDV
eukprot:TRINITY_DN3974_c0_g1_i1.p1 TRINITY_DN3974_c0_g1~~TRINITY_DN3974_c0_g1_i1.p1  ORF type:complete len:312 (-),score=12.81 TRINITY_DN3974_c0_g1_i1:36-971(-)